VTSESFDFWIGEWDVRWTDGDGQPQSGTNSVTRIDGTIRELFCAPEPAGAYMGASVSRWDDSGSVWVQDYWDNRGYHAAFRGSRDADRLVLDRTSDLETGALTRLVWSDIGADSITWDYERQTADGRWATTWRIRYTRRDPKGSTAPI
jgi:hypothetical protein